MREYVLTYCVWQALNLYSRTNSYMGIPIPLHFRKDILNYKNKK